MRNWLEHMPKLEDYSIKMKKSICRSSQIWVHFRQKQMSGWEIKTTVRFILLQLEQQLSKRQEITNVTPLQRFSNSQPAGRCLRCTQRHPWLSFGKRPRTLFFCKCPRWFHWKCYRIHILNVVCHILSSYNDFANVWVFSFNVLTELKLHDI